MEVDVSIDTQTLSNQQLNHSTKEIDTGIDRVSDRVCDIETRRRRQRHYLMSEINLTI